MSKLTDKQNEVIGKAYECYLQSIESEEQKLNDKNLEIALNKFKGKLKLWKSNDDMNFIIDFALSDEAAIFAADGQGKSAKSGFIQFMNMKIVKKNFEQMLSCKFSIEDNSKKHMELREYDIKEYLDSNKFDFKKANLLTGRLVLMIFTDLYTTIADIDALKDVCEKLEKPFAKEERYLAKQRQIRYMTDTYLKENNLYDGLTELSRALIGWFIAEV